MKCTISLKKMGESFMPNCIKRWLRFAERGDKADNGIQEQEKQSAPSSDMMDIDSITAAFSHMR